MTNDITMQMKMQERQHQHESRMAFLSLLKEDQELKYIAIIAGGTAVLALQTLYNAESEDEKKASWKSFWDQVATSAALVSPIGALLKGADMAAKDPLGAGVAGMTSLATACLLLKCAGDSEGGGLGSIGALLGGA